jgi:DNA-directed RNA polymerase specialized sigma24 family protein
METGTVADLVRRAREGDRAAWGGLTRRYVGLVHAVCRCYRLGDRDAAAVNQVVWLRLAEHLPRIHSPEAVGGWIAAVARTECLRVLRVRGRIVHTGDEIGPDPAAPTSAAPDPGQVSPTDDAGAHALLTAYASLDAAGQRLLRVLVAEPRPGHDEISAALDLPVDEIDRARDRSLGQLRGALGAGSGAGAGR